MQTSVFILGGGGHTKVLLDALFKIENITILGILEKDPKQYGKTIFGIPVSGPEDHVLSQYQPAQIKLINGIGTVGVTQARKLIFEKFKLQGYEFLTLCHPKAYIGHEVILNEGAQIFAGSIIQPNVRIGKNVIVNTNASIDHDCEISDHVHIAPSVTLCGNVVVGNGTHIGSGAVVRQGIKIASNCLIAAGAIVVEDVKEGAKIAGIPAKEMV